MSADQIRPCDRKSIDRKSSTAIEANDRAHLIQDDWAEDVCHLDDDPRCERKAQQHTHKKKNKNQKIQSVLLSGQCEWKCKISKKKRKQNGTHTNESMS